jgi:hypothetical protein
MGVWLGVAIDSLKFHPGVPCPTLLRTAVGPPLKRPYGRFRVGPPGLLPPWAPYAYGWLAVRPQWAEMRQKWD